MKVPFMPLCQCVMGNLVDLLTFQQRWAPNGAFQIYKWLLLSNLNAKSNRNYKHFGHNRHMWTIYKKLICPFSFNT